MRGRSRNCRDVTPSASAQIDAPALQLLPAQPYDLARFKTVTVHSHYHVEINKQRYSVPHALIGLKLDACITTGASYAPYQLSFRKADYRRSPRLPAK
ncbi:hypothetical protein J2777_002988 [Paraburkholderia graminis]|nr:hypothetical protein [Paraburkholderia graminis]